MRFLPRVSTLPRLCVAPRRNLRTTVMFTMATPFFRRLAAAAAWIWAVVFPEARAAKIKSCSGEVKCGAMVVPPTAIRNRGLLAWAQACAICKDLQINNTH